MKLPQKKRRKNAKGTFIRTGQKTPYRKSTQEEIQECIARIEVLLSTHVRKHEIHKIIKKEFNIEWRQTDRHMASARLNMMERLRQNKEYHRSGSLAVYQGVIEAGTLKERIAAQERIDKLLGLEQPKLIGVGGIDGSAPIKVEETKKFDPAKLSVEQLKQLKTIVKDGKAEPKENQPA